MILDPERVQSDLRPISRPASQTAQNHSDSHLRCANRVPDYRRMGLGETTGTEKDSASEPGKKDSSARTYFIG
jgi:hypothetical protein